MKRRVKRSLKIEWLNSVCNRTLLFAIDTQTNEKLFIFLIHRDLPVRQLLKHFKTVHELCPKNADISLADTFLFIQHRRHFKIKKSIRFRIVGNALMYNKPNETSVQEVNTIIQEIVIVCTCDL